MLEKNNISRIIFVLIFFITPALQAQENNGKITKEDQVEFVDKVCKLLNENYVFPEVASKIEHHLKEKLAANAFDNLTEVQQFADAMTSEVLYISNDKHMRVRIRNGRSSIPAERPDQLLVIMNTKKECKARTTASEKLKSWKEI